MKPAWTLPILLLMAGAGCTNNRPGKVAPATLTQPRVVSPLTVKSQQIAVPAPVPPPVPAPKETLSADDIAYLRWLMQLDQAVQGLMQQQARTLPPAMEQKEQIRKIALMRGWAADSRQTSASLDSNASMAENFTTRLRQVQTQFQNQPVPVACGGVAEGYRRVLATLVDASDFNARIYRQLADLMHNSRAATQMVPPELQDGGIAIDNKLRTDLQSARDSTNTALSDITRRYSDQMPADIAAFRVR